MYLPPPTGPDPLRRLSDELHELATRFADHPVTVQEVIVALGTRASALVSVILALPMCAPVGIPGLSGPFGLIILVLVARFAFGHKPWLPKKLMAVKLPPRFFRALLEGTSKLVGWIERRLRPRLPWVTSSTWLVRTHMMMVCFAAFLLMLPIVGVPFTNTLPALVIIAGILGVLERDGVAVIVSYVILLATLIYFAASATVIYRVLQHAWDWFADA